MNTTPTAGFPRFIRPFGLRGVTAVLLGLLSMSVTARADDAASLVINGNFESATKDPAWPDGWGRPRVGAGSWEAEEAGHFMRLQATAPGQMVMLYRLVQIPAGVKALEVSARVRVSGLKLGAQTWFDARIVADFKDAAGAKVKGAKPLVFRKDTDGWVERKAAFLVPEGAVSIELMPALFNTEAGTLDLDNLKVVAVDPATLTP